jgi:predicted membrane protein
MYLVVISLKHNINLVMSISTYPNPRRNNRALGGLILIAVGGFLLLHQFNWFFFPDWLFSFPSLLIVLGLYIGTKKNFQTIGWFIMVLVGACLLLEDIIPGIDIGDFLWPIAIIALGIWVIMRRNKPMAGKFGRQNYTNTAGTSNPASDPIDVDYTVKDDSFTPKEEPFTPPHSSSNTYNGDDYISSTSIFGSVKKVVLSKDFKGGDVVNAFGGCELDFTKADIHGRVMLDVTQLFGGLKLIVPAHWQVTSELTAVFAGIDDKRIPNPGGQSTDKVLVLSGTSIFAGIDVRSF